METMERVVEQGDQQLLYMCIYKGLIMLCNCTKCSFLLKFYGVLSNLFRVPILHFLVKSMGYII